MVFYLLISFIFIVVIAITYIHISTTRKTKKNAKNNHWSVYLFRIFTELLPIIIMPIFSVLFLPLKCFTSTANALYLDDFPTVECFSGEHLVHFFISILFLLIFLIITLTITMFAFEYRRKSPNSLARQIFLKYIIFDNFFFFKKKKVYFSWRFSFLYTKNSAFNSFHIFSNGKIRDFPTCNIYHICICPLLHIQ